MPPLDDEGGPQRAIGLESVGALGATTGLNPNMASRPGVLKAFYEARRAMIAEFLPLMTVLTPAELEEEAVGTAGQITGLAALEREGGCDV